MVVPALIVSSYIIYSWPTRTRYRYTVEVDTPLGVRRGSVVIEDTTRKQLRLVPGMPRYTTTQRAEAVAVHLPHKQTLFAILKQDGGLSFGYITYWALGPKGSPKRKIGAPPTPMSVHIGGEGTGIRYQEGIPMLVRFRNINDPNTIEKVDPDNLAASFGPGYHLRRVTVQVTSDNVRLGVLNLLPWWKDYTTKLFNGTCCGELSSVKSLSGHITLSAFSTEWKDKYYE